MRIAICDDDAQTLELMQSYVSRYAESRSKTLHAECFQTPDKLLALLQQNEYNNFDVIFIDISMPGRSGIEVASIIRNHNFNIYIVFITGLLNHMPDAFRLHAFDYISKLRCRKQNIAKSVIHRCFQRGMRTGQAKRRDYINSHRH